jgi:hypothetical protein
MASSRGGQKAGEAVSVHCTVSRSRSRRGVQSAESVHRAGEAGERAGELAYSAG